MPRRSRRGFVVVQFLATSFRRRSSAAKLHIITMYPPSTAKLKCPIESEPLGTDFAMMEARAETLNGLFDEWDKPRRASRQRSESIPKYGTVDWLFREYQISKAYLEKVAVRSRKDYEWAMEQICNIETKNGDRVGGRPVKTITSPRGRQALRQIPLRRGEARRADSAEAGAAADRRETGRLVPQGVARGPSPLPRRSSLKTSRIPGSASPSRSRQRRTSRP